MLVLAGFGFTAWRLQQATQLQRVEQELEQRVAVIAGALRRGGGVPGRQPQDRPAFAGPPPLEARLSARDLSFFEGEPDTAFYYAVWQRNERAIARSATAPADLPRPERGPGPRASRWRGTRQERFHFLPTGECILVGRDIRQ